jgi:hypothetical protein
MKVLWLKDKALIRPLSLQRKVQQTLFPLRMIF